MRSHFSGLLQLQEFSMEMTFKKADSDLIHLTRKLELLCQNQAAGDDRKNPLELLHKVTAVKNEYKALVQEAAEIQKVQADTMDYFRSQLPIALQALQQLQQQVGMVGSETDKAKVKELENLLDIQVSSVTSSSAANGSEQRSTGPQAEPSQPAGSRAEESQEDSLGAEGPEKPAAASACEFFEDPVESRAALRAASQEVVELSQEELESVSELIRGRVKLVDVNAVYRRLFRHFKEEGNRETLSSSDMHKMGLRVFGATGQAKLKVLRVLKLLTISTKGDVKLM
ncbi:hypothetical protein ACOMHN_051246 [Nucella lapillus]